MSETNKDLAKIQSDLDAANAKNAALLAEKDALEKAINTDTKTLKVLGKYKNDGGTYAFADGAIMTRLPDGSAVPTTELIKLANDAKYVPSKEALQNYHSLNGLSHELAKERMEHLIEIKYGLLNQVK